MHTEVAPDQIAEYVTLVSKSPVTVIDQLFSVQTTPKTASINSQFQFQFQFQSQEHLEALAMRATSLCSIRLTSLADQDHLLAKYDI
jgi:hypothetical protein